MKVRLFPMHQNKIKSCLPTFPSTKANKLNKNMYHKTAGHKWKKNIVHINTCTSFVNYNEQWLFTSGI